MYNYLQEEKLNKYVKRYIENRAMLGTISQDIVDKYMCLLTLSDFMAVMGVVRDKGFTLSQDDYDVIDQYIYNLFSDGTKLLPYPIFNLKYLESFKVRDIDKYLYITDSDGAIRTTVNYDNPRVVVL